LEINDPNNVVPLLGGPIRIIFLINFFDLLIGFVN